MSVDIPDDLEPLLWGLLLPVFAWALGKCVSWLEKKIRRACAPLDKPHRGDTQAGATRPLRWLWQSLLAAWLVGLIVGAAAFLPREHHPFSAIMLIALPFHVVVAPLVWFAVLQSLETSDVVWNEIGVTGPSSSLSRERLFISWSDIAKIGRTEFGGRWIADSNGRRIIWRNHVGGPHVWQAVLLRRPEFAAEVSRLEMEDTALTSS